MNQVYNNEEKNIVLEISDDGYNAYLTIDKPEEFINESDIIKLIEQSGIKYGIDAAKQF